MFYMFFFLPILSTSRLIICHSCIHLQAITDAVMFVGTGIVLAAFSTITDTVRLVRTGIVLAAFSTITDIVTVRLVRTGTVLAAFSTITLSGLSEQGLCWLHSGSMVQQEFASYCCCLLSFVMYVCVYIFII